MQDRYAGDLGDYAKLGLLRAVCRPPLNVGLVWYLTPDESHNRDGRHIGYLKPGHAWRERLARCDRRLHEALRAMVLDRGERSVAALNKLDIWPPETRLFSDRLGFEGLAVPARAPHRRQWVERALAATRGAAVVCVDPDNGLETPSVKPHHARGPKHAFVDELQPFWQRGQSLIVYQHTHRRGTAAEQVARRLPGLRDAFQGAAAIHALRFRRGTSRVFLVIGHPEHGAAIDERIGDMLASPWGDHFERLEVG